jgi:hypothetical protein
LAGLGERPDRPRAPARIRAVQGQMIQRLRHQTAERAEEVGRETSLDPAIRGPAATAKGKPSVEVVLKGGERVPDKRSRRQSSRALEKHAVS